MLHLYNYQKQDYGKLLGNDVLDASKGALFQSNGLLPETTNRTILIGIGGTGVRTIDAVKGVISKRLNPAWKDYVAFLGLDTSWTELDNASYLNADEKLMYTKPGIVQRMAQPSTYPAAVCAFMPENTQLGNLDSDGAGRTRLVGKVKIHDQQPGAIGVDEEIVNKLVTIRSSVLAPLSSSVGNYEVYVIGSVSGGTCSGAFMELPALIRKAFPNRIKVNGMLYLPDTLTSLDPVNAAALKANGYATLKELNYYVGMFMRPNNSEKWTFNNPAARELVYKSTTANEQFLDIPYLVGSSNGAAADAAQVAKETIAEFLVSLLGKITSPTGAVFLTSAFESNSKAASKLATRLTMPGNDEAEAEGEFHEFPKRFAAIGFAEASVPQKRVRAYSVGSLCEKAGLRPVAPEERANMIASGTLGVVPFRGEDDLLNAQDGTTKALELLAPIKNVFQWVSNVDFQFVRDVAKCDVTWDEIRERKYDSQATTTLTDNSVVAQTSTAVMDAIRSKIRDAFKKYQENVKTYVQTEGPYAFANLFEGRFFPVNDYGGYGIQDILRHMLNGELLNGERNGFVSFSFLKVDSTKNALDGVRDAIRTTSAGLIGKFVDVHGTRKSQAASWVSAYENWTKARIIEKRYPVFFGPTGAFKEEFAAPATILSQKIKAFARLTESLTGIYKELGRSMTSFDSFRATQDNKTEVNLAGVSDASYRWIFQQTESALEAANASKFRENLVEDFFADMDGWLDIPEHVVTTTTNNEVKLTVPDVAVPAREAFDRFVSKEFPSTLDVSIEQMFVQMKQVGTSYDASADMIMESLVSRSQPQFNGDIPDDSKFAYVMYPSSLLQSTGEGKQIATAIEAAAKRKFPGVQAYASDNAESIMFYQQACPMEIYRLSELKDWEKEYEDGVKGIQFRETYLHGLSPDVDVITKVGERTRYIENMPWTDYPAISRQTGDPRERDAASGKVSREGLLRLELDKLIDQARTLGVLYSEKKSDGKWIVRRVYCDKATDWNFDIMSCAPDERGFLPIGKTLAENVALQNGKTLDAISADVVLATGGLMNKPHATEDLAWKYAARTLRAHVPMYIEVRETVKKFAPWAKDILAWNEQVSRQYLPGKMIHMINAGLIRMKDDGSWVIRQAKGGEQPLANLSATMVKFLPPKDKQKVENGLLAYYLFGKLSKLLGDSADRFDAEFRRAQDRLQELVASEEVEELERSQKNAEKLLKEIEDLVEKGARVDGSDQPPRDKLLKAYPSLSADELKDIETFYYRLGLWQAI